MVNIDRVRVVWPNVIGGPGVSTYYVQSGPPAVAKIRLFLDNMKSYLPIGIQLQVENAGDTIDSVTGNLTGSWSVSAAAVVAGTANGVFSGSSGFAVKWNTVDIVNNHRLRGRTYFVPGGSSVYQSDGSIDETKRSGIVIVANAFITDMGTDLKIWSRPRAAAPAWTDRRGITHPAVSARAGATGVVTSSAVPDKAVVLTSRRD